MKKLLPLLLGLALLSKTDAFGLTLYFWDDNGAAAGCSGTTPSGTWGTDAFWTESAAGETATVAWNPGHYAVFSAGTNATGAYTIYVNGEVQVADIHVDRGEVTFEPAPVTGGSLKLVDRDGVTTPRLLGCGSFDDNAVARFNVPITDATGVVRYKVGTVIFGATNTFTGSLTIESGFTRCAVPYAFSAAPSLVLANLDMTRTDVSPFWQYWAAVFQTGGLDQQLGTLKFAGTNTAVERSLDLGNGSGTLSFADSSAEDWTGYTLTVKKYAWGSSRLRFGTSNTGLTATQLSRIQFADFTNQPSVIDSNGYVMPFIVQQPQSCAAVVGGTARFSVTVTGNTNRTYQWQLSQVDLVGRTNNPLVLTNIQPSDFVTNTPPSDFEGYRVVVSSPDGSATSQVASLTEAVRPQLKTPEFNLATVYLSFLAEYGPVYVVEYADAMNDNPLWHEMTSLNGTNGTLLVTDNNATNSVRFYRIRMR